MKTTLRILTVLLLCMILCFCLSVAASAETVADGTCGAQENNLTWTLDDAGTLTISGTGEMANYEQGTAPWYGNRLSISSVVIENGVTSFGSYAFYYCIKMTDVTIPDSVTSIGNHAFDGCAKLSGVMIPNSLSYIGTYAFSGCSALTSMTIPGGVWSITNYVFFGCKSLTNVIISDGVASIGGSAFYGCSSLDSVTIPSSVKSIGNYAFYDCNSLTSVTIPYGVTSINRASFCGCSSLLSVTIPKSVQRIEDDAFMGCSSLTSVTIPEGVTSIGNSAFSSSGLISATIPSSVVIIDNYAFAGCSLTEIIIPEGVVSIGYRAFRGCGSLSSVFISAGVTSIDSEVFSDCENLTEIKVDADNPNYCDVNGVLFDKNVKTLLHFPRGWEGTFEIPDSVTDMGSFSNSYGLTSVKISENVTSINAYAFYNCSNLTSVTIPNSVTNIDYDTFYNCSSLAVVYYGGTESQWNSIAIGYGNEHLKTALRFYNGETPDVCTISFDPNGATSGSMSPMTVESGKAFALNPCNYWLQNHSFIGWQDQIGKGYADGGTLITTEDLTLTAQWKRTAYTISFDGNGGGGAMPTQTVSDGSSIYLPGNGFTVPYGMTFAGWNTKADGNGTFYKASTIITPEDDMTLYAQWGESVAITFESNGGAGEMSPQVVVKGVETALNKNAFSRTNYAFTSWLDQYGNNYMDKETIIPTEDLTLTAQWTRSHFNITFDPNGGGGWMMDSMTVESGKTITLNTCSYQRQNYVFIGWKDQNGKGYADEGTVTPTEDLTLYAQWRRTAYAIRYDSNGGGGGTSTQSVSVGSSASVWENPFNIPYGQKFACWNTMPDGSGAAFAPGDTITPTYDMTLYAQWRDGVTIWFYPGDAEGSATSEDVPMGYPVKLPTASSLGFTANEGEIFLGWEINGVLFKAREEHTFTDDTSVTARWAKRIKVSFDLNGGSGTKKAQYIPKDIPTNLAKMSSIGYARTGFEFVGWGLSPYIDPGSPNIIPDAGEVNFDYDVVLYAIWRQKAFVGTVELIGDESGYEDRAYFGETLTAEINGESLFTVFTYQWLRDGAVIPDATKVSYVVGEIDFGHSLSCAVTAIEAPENATKTSYMKLVGIDVEEKQLVDNGLTEFDAIRGLTPDMLYSIDGGAKQSVSLDSQGRMPVTQQGIYQFYKNGALVGTVKVVNWFSLSYSISASTDYSSSSSSSSGAGAVLMRYGNQQLTASTRITDTNGNVIIKGNGTISWLVRDGANLTNDITMTIKPSSISYAHVSLNDDDYSSLGNGESTITVSPVMGPMRYKIVFSTDPVYPPLPAAVIDEATFPDPAFRRYVLANIDRDGDGVLYSDEINRTIVISCSNYGISSLKGIEVFTNLINLSCQSNNLTELDLSGCPHLTTLYCADNSLTALDVSTCPVLSSLNCSNNVLSSLNVSNCPGLTTLDCSGNLLAALDLSGNPQLRSLDCYDNLIHSLDLNNNLELITVYCFDNLMTRINVDGLTALTTLNSSGNLLTELDMSGCGALRTLNCGGNDLTALELDGCGSLSTLGCSQNALTELDLSACTGLRRLNCTYNRLTSINLSGYSTLTSLSCFNNELTELQVRGCAALKALNCSSNALIELDLNGCDTLLMLVESVEPDIGWSVTYGSGNLMLSYDFGVTLLNSLPDPDFILPASLTTIEPEAFAGGVFVYVVVPEQVTAIGSRAFADCPNLRYVEIQGPATEIAEDAFENVSGLTILDRSGLPAAD